jgi:hypothetical protein
MTIVTTIVVRVARLRFTSLRVVMPEEMGYYGRESANAKSAATLRACSK